MSKHENEDPCLDCDGEAMCACSGCPVLEKRIIDSDPCGDRTCPCEDIGGCDYDGS